MLAVRNFQTGLSFENKLDYYRTEADGRNNNNDDRESSYPLIRPWYIL